MYQPIVICIGLRYYIRELLSDCFTRIVSWFPIIAIALGISTLIIVLSVMNGFEKKLKDNILKYIPHAIITNYKKQIDPKIISCSKLKSFNKNIKYIKPIITSEVIIQSNYNISLGIMVGVKQSDLELLFNNTTSSYLCYSDLLDHQYNVIIGSKLAYDLKVKYGDKVRLTVPDVVSNTLIGKIPSQRLFTVVGIFDTANEDNYYQLIINQKDASHLMHYNDGYITGWRIWLNDPLKVNQLFNKSFPNDLIIYDWRKIKGEFFQAVFMEKNIIIFLFSLIVIVAMFSIITLLNISILEKKTDISILIVQGLTRIKIMIIFLIRGTISGAIGILLGILIGIMLTHQINNIISCIFSYFKEDAVYIEIINYSKQIIFISLTSFIITLLITIYSSWYITKINLIDILRNE